MHALLDALSEQEFAQVESLRQAFMKAAKDSGLADVIGEVM